MVNSECNVGRTRVCNVVLGGLQAAENEVNE
jgi:hypothetical protein